MEHIDENQKPSESFAHSNEKLATGVLEISLKVLRKSTKENSQDIAFPYPSSPDPEGHEETSDWYLHR